MGEDKSAELCRKGGIAQGLHYSWSKEFPEPGKKRLDANTINSLGQFFCPLRITRKPNDWQPG